MLVTPINYGSAPIFLATNLPGRPPAKSAEAKMNSAEFKIGCVPDAPWLQIDAQSGVFSLADSNAVPTELTDEESKPLGPGSICTVRKGDIASVDVVVFAPTPWPTMSYSYGGTTVLYVTVGDKTPRLEVKGDTTGSPPTRFSASCASQSSSGKPEFVFDNLAGIATWKGHSIFTLNVGTGELQLKPAISLTKVFDAMDQTGIRRKIDLQCTIFGHYEWTSSFPGPVLTHRVRLQIRDSTCWMKAKLSFAEAHTQTVTGSDTLSACRQLCRDTAFCAHFGLTTSVPHQCVFYSGLCANASDALCIHKDLDVYAKNGGCGERHSCIRLTLPHFQYISGDYCARGENLAQKDQGPVYFKHGFSRQAGTARSLSFCMVFAHVATLLILNFERSCPAVVPDLHLCYPAA